MTPSEYFKISSGPRGSENYMMSRTSLLMFFENPWAWKNGKTIKSTASMEWGSLVDCLYLTPEEFEPTYKIRPAFYPSPTKANPENMKPWNANSNTCKAILKEIKDSGKIPLMQRRLKSSDSLNVNYEDARAAVAVLHADENAKRVFGDTDKQRVCQWDHVCPVTGLTVKLKCMMDAVSREYDYQADFKTTKDASIDAFRRSGLGFRYDIQAAFYQWGHAENYESKSNFIFVAQENTAPYAVSTMEMAPEDYESGKTGHETKWKWYPGYEDMLLFYCYCLSEDYWPSYLDPRAVRDFLQKKKHGNTKAKLKDMSTVVQSFRFID